MNSRSNNHPLQKHHYIDAHERPELLSRRVFAPLPPPRSFIAGILLLASNPNFRVKTHKAYNMI